MGNPILPGTLLFGHYLTSFLKNGVEKDHTKIYPEDLNSPCLEHSNSGLRIAVALMVCPGIVCFYWESNPVVGKLKLLNPTMLLFAAILLMPPISGVDSTAPARRPF